MKTKSLLLLISAMAIGAFAAPATSYNPGLDGFIVPLRNAGSLSTARKSDMIYTLGNPVLTDDVNLYHIYYGNVSLFKSMRVYNLILRFNYNGNQWTESQKSILEHFNNNIGDSKWYNINRSKLMASHSRGSLLVVLGTNYEMIA